MSGADAAIGASAARLLQSLLPGPRPLSAPLASDAAALIRADLAVATKEGKIGITDAGRLHLVRRLAGRSPVGAFRAQHLALTDASPARPGSGHSALLDESESPLLWLARRKGRDGRALIEPHHFQAGERLRVEFTLGQMMPRTTSNWHAPVAGRRRGAGEGGHPAERVVAARQRVRQALDAVGPELSGLLLDVCCFLKKLDDVERERAWPARSAKVVLQLALERLARHYGYGSTAQGCSRQPVRTWLAADAASAAAGEDQAATAARASR